MSREAHGPRSLALLPGAVARLGAVIALAIVLVSTLVGRWGQPPPARQAHRPARHASPDAYLAYDHFMSASTRFFDPATGREVRASYPAGGRLMYGSPSPWRDERGGWQVVGRWNDTEDGSDSRGPCLMRLAMPGGAILDRIALESNPTGPPCWSPDTTARVLFTIWDGQLYHYDFDGDRIADDSGSGDSRGPRPLPWRGGRPPAPGHAWMGDPSWPKEPRLGGRIFVSLSRLTWNAGQLEALAPRIWWLRLDPVEVAITAAGPLIRAEPDDRDGDDDDVAERYPVLGTTAEGGLILAYLGQPRAGRGWQLRIAPVEIDPRTGDPTVRRGAVRVVDGDCTRAAPVISADGRWVCSLSGEASRGWRVRRFPIGGGRPPQPAHRASARPLVCPGRITSGVPWPDAGGPDWCTCLAGGIDGTTVPGTFSASEPFPLLVRSEE